MTRVFIHIGRAKTGTTAIQQLMAMNAAALNDCGLRYAKTGLFHNAHHQLAWALHQEASWAGARYWYHAANYAVMEHDPDQYWAMFRAEVQAAPDLTFILSSEEFGVAAPRIAPIMANRLSGLDVRLVVYVRRQDQFLQSLYNQAVKGQEDRFAGDFQSYIKPILRYGEADIMHMLTPFTEVFGSDHVLLRVYEKEQLKGDVCTDFLDVLGVAESAAFSLPVRESNLGLDWRGIALIRRLNALSIDPTLRDQLVTQILRAFSTGGKFSSHEIISAEERLAIMAHFQQSNAEAARCFLNRDDGVLFTSQVTPGDAPRHADPENTDFDAMADLWGECVRKCLLHMENLAHDRERLLRDWSEHQAVIADLDGKLAAAGTLWKEQQAYIKELENRLAQIQTPT